MQDLHRMVVAETWNETLAALSAFDCPAKISFTVDASGTWGYGTYFEMHWFQLHWNRLLQDTHISVKELTPIVIATALWGHHWHLKSVRVLSDNTATVTTINNHSSRLKETTHLLWCLAFLSAKFQCQISANHIARVHNNAMDTLFCNQLSCFYSILPQADASSMAIRTSTTTATSNHRQARLDLAMEQYFSAGLAPSTCRVYEAGYKRYIIPLTLIFFNKTQIPYLLTIICHTIQPSAFY